MQHCVTSNGLEYLLEDDDGDGSPIFTFKSEIGYLSIFFWNILGEYTDIVVSHGYKGLSLVTDKLILETDAKWEYEHMEYRNFTNVEIKGILQALYDPPLRYVSVIEKWPPRWTTIQQLKALYETL